MIAAVADTHTALWHLFNDPRLSPPAAEFIAQAAAARRNIAVSSITLAEIVYLIEKGRLPAPAYTELMQALANPNHLLKEAALNSTVVEAMRNVSRADVPDMPDRIIAATSLQLGVPVISRDRHIRSRMLTTIW